MEAKLEKTFFKLAQNEVSVFSVVVKSDKTESITPKLLGVEGCCLQSEGYNQFGEFFERAFLLRAGVESRLWFYLKAPKKIGEIPFTVEIYAQNGEGAFSQKCTLCVTEETADDTQFDDIYSLRRLVWLNSVRGIDDTVPAPFTPVVVEAHTVKILGRELTFDAFGLPVSLCSYFTQGVKLGDEGREILSKGMHFCVCGQTFENRSLLIMGKSDKASVSAKNESQDFLWELKAVIEFDGYVVYEMSLTAKQDITTEVRFEIPVSEYSRKYFMGLGKDGGLFNDQLDWKWDKQKQQDSFWVGNVNAGLRLQFKDEDYQKPLVNIYYAHKPLLLPKSWHNGGEGGIRYENGKFVAYAGEKTFKAGETARFDFTFLLTPMKELDIKKNLNMRFYQKLEGNPEEWFKKAKEKGANILNIHHGNDLNPYINYPFFECDALTKFVENAHENGIKVGVYYTLRELTVNIPDFSALRDFGDEIFVKRDESVCVQSWQSEASDWVFKNVGTDVIPAWRQALQGEKYKECFDSSVITNGSSRFCNFYIEGLHHLLETTKIDGLYIDDVAYGRETMKRVRKTLDTHTGRYIDLHAWNHNTDISGYANSLNLYAEILPYIDQLWVGEGFNYETSPDFWLVEISGIPFGLMSEMLAADYQTIVNPWKGLLYGMTMRLGWGKEADPSNLWKVFDDYELSNGEMIGWWDQSNAFISGDSDVLITQYRQSDKNYLAVANFGETDKTIELRRKDGKKCGFYAPFIERFQEEMRTEGKLALPKAKGLFLVVED